MVRAHEPRAGPQGDSAPQILTADRLGRTLRITFLDSWWTASHDGSGTAVGISSLSAALRRLGHEVTVLRPPSGRGRLTDRILFNLRLPVRLRAEPTPDLVVGFDVDGVRWGGTVGRPSPYVVALKGVAWDEARFAQTVPEHGLLSTLGLVERRNARSADRVIVPSAYSAEVARRVYGLSADRIRVVPEPIDIALWDSLRGRGPTTPDRPTILSVARQYRRKDTATLLRALSRVRDAVPGVHLRIVGGGPELPRLRSLAGHLRLEGVVTFHGPVADDGAVRQAFLEAHVFCLPSRQEGFGIAFLEAMAAGLPVVAARAGAVPELVIDGETGLLVRAGDHEELAEALTRLLREPSTRARFGEEGLRRAGSYDLEPVGRAFLVAAGLTP
ncbi:MAG: glycosyltransferase family 1 protein [Gemmatimonadetes bacterium]|nr:glycosyltransferase family 1 protein [Gemmatimonadota bacterium]